MARRPSKRQSTEQWTARLASWFRWITSPLMQQTVAVLVILLALLIFIALANLTSGTWLNARVDNLRYIFGWGVVPVAFALGAAGVFTLLHHLDRPIAWRWRPVVGLELIFFSLLGLTHLIAGRSDPWRLIETGWGGGIVGWAIVHTLSSYVGPLAAGTILALILVLGTGLTFDLTLQDLAGWLRRSRIRRPVPGQKPARSRPAEPRIPSARRRRAAPQSQASPAPSKAPPSAAPSRAPGPAASSAPSRRPPSAPSPPPPPARAPAEPIPLAQAAVGGELPPLDLLEEGEEIGLSDSELREKSRTIVETLHQFGLPVQVVEVRRGPTVTQFGVAPGYTEGGQRRAKKVRVSQIASLADDLALALAAASLRVEAPVPGRSVVGIEVPNDEVSVVTLRSVMESEAFQKVDTPLAVALGQDIAGAPIVADLGLMPHLLISGTTGSGKSICIKALATCLAMTNRPEELRMVMIDPKMVELVQFNGLPHVYGHTEYDLDRVGQVLRWVAYQMDDRYKRFAAVGARFLDDYNRKVSQRAPQERLPRIVVFIDELADMMMLAPEKTERTICRIAQMARATGIHLIVATQRPSVDVVTGLIKANFPARISFATASQTDSRVILDMPGAETLLGRGDMLYLASDAGHPVRVQGCFVSEQEIGRVVRHWKQQAPRWATTPPWESMMSSSTGEVALEDEDQDGKLEEAIELIRKRKTVSASYLQRQLRVGYPRAARLMEQLEEMGLVGPQKSAGRPRRVIGGEMD
jgi:S-DNA-T family DNA segregation ATPase FtsK/SpoIIIE